MAEQTITQRILVVSKINSTHDGLKRVFGTEDRVGATTIEGLNNALSDAESLPLYEISHAQEWREAIETVSCACQRNQPYELVFLDLCTQEEVNIPTLIQRFLSVDSNLKFAVSATDLNSLHQLSRLFNSQQLVLLRKPFKMEDLGRLLRSVLSRAKKLVPDETIVVEPRRTEDKKADISYYFKWPSELTLFMQRLDTMDSDLEVAIHEDSSVRVSGLDLDAYKRVNNAYVACVFEKNSLL